MAEDLKIIRGVITRLFHNSPKWSAGRLLPDRSDVTRGGEISVAGCFYAVEGEYLIIEGKWTDHAKYGRQFQVSRQIREIESISVEGLAGWLAVHGEARGIGPVKAEKIAKEFGENFTGILRDNPEQIAIFAQVSLEVLRELSVDWFEHEELNVIGTKLACYQLTAHQIHALYNRFKGAIVDLLKEDPYLLVGEVDGLGFKRVDEIARKVGVSTTHPGRLAASLLYCLHQERNDGSTCMERGNLIGTATEILDYRESDGETILSDAIGRLVGKNQKIVEYDVTEQRSVYALPSCWKHERFIMDFLMAANKPNPNFASKVDHLVPETIGVGLHLDDSQRRAVAMALRNRACLISGGAGAGKSTLIQAVVQVYQQDHLRVNLCAPTGKASRRIEEIVGQQAETIHRMLGYKPPYGFPDDIQLDTDVVICDEASMVSSDLAYYLLRAIGPETALNLVGDHHQLPPVGAGALLRDCIQNELLPMTVLAKCHRQAGPLKRNCSAILSGEVHPTETGEDGSIPWVVMRKFDLTQQVLDYLEGLFVRGLADKLGVDPLKNVQFLTPQHGGPVGTRALNILLQRLHQKSRGVELAPVDPDSKPKILPGDKVIQTKNNYKLEIMNGHQGYVVSTEPYLVVDFGEGRIIGIPKECKGEIELAYALTVHKVQGSQFPVVVFVCHKAHTYMLNRSLLYTAATRAMRSCVIVGDDAGVSKAARTLKANERRTLLPLLARKQDCEA